MKKAEWRRALAYLYDEHLGPHLPYWRGRRHPFEYSEERYQLEQLADAVDVMRFADRHRSAVAQERLRAEISVIAQAGRRVTNLDERTGLARVLSEHRQLIAQELTPEDLPRHDHEFLETAGVRDPETDLLVAVERLKERAETPASADERGAHRGAAEIAVRESERIEEALAEPDAGAQGPRQPPDKPPRRPFKGLGGVGKGFGLVLADTLVLVEWPIVTPEAAKAGALASFALGWDGILSGVGDLRGE